MVNEINIEKQIQEATKNLDDDNKLLGRTLLQPFAPANSGSRALMASVHAEHLMVPNKGEVPIIQTGFETEFGEHSSSHIRSKSNYTVIDKINKFSFRDDHYYLIVQDMDTGIYDVIERVLYNHNTESYGYLWKNDRLDSLKPGSKISKGSVLKTSVGFDEFGNKMNGVNLTTLYLACNQNMEDSIIISESAAKKLETSLVKTTGITINDNDVLRNVYGDENVYKTFPDVGESTKDGMFCSIRRLENENILYSLSQARLREPMISDRDILINGVVADIDVYCNNPTVLSESFYNQQLYFYYNEKMEFNKKVVEHVAPLAMNGVLSYNLQKLYAIARDSINGKQFFKEKQFSNVIMEVVVVERITMDTGDKMCDRYGGKGVVSEIRPDSQMPMLDNGQIVEVIKNQSTCINRENIGQLHEQSLSFIGMRLIDYFKTGALSYSNMLKMVYEFVSMVDKEQASDMIKCIDFDDEWGCKIYMESIINDDNAIILSTPPFTTPINIDTIAEIYRRFPWIKPYTVMMPMEDSNGNIIFGPAKRKLIVGKIYNYRLKQFAEEKFSVTSMSATNLKGLNTRSRANKIYETKYTKTPIMFGGMETGDLAHIGMQYVVMNLMLYSSSPQARRLFEQLLIGDPYDIDIRLDEDSKNRNAEIINALFKTMGLKLVFTKIPKKKKEMVKNIMIKDVPNKGFNYKTNIRGIIGHDGELQMKYGIAVRNNKGTPMIKKIMCERVDKDGKSIRSPREDSWYDDTRKSTDS